MCCATYLSPFLDLVIRTRPLHTIHSRYKMTERYKCTLSAEALKKAVAELNEPEDNVVRLAAIDRLRERFQDEVKNLTLIRSDDSFLIR